MINRSKAGKATQSRELWCKQYGGEINTDNLDTTHNAMAQNRLKSLQSFSLLWRGHSNLSILSPHYESWDQSITQRTRAIIGHQFSMLASTKKRQYQNFCSQTNKFCNQITKKCFDASSIHRHRFHFKGNKMQP